MTVGDPIGTLVSASTASTRGRYGGPGEERRKKKEYQDSYYYCIVIGCYILPLYGGGVRWGCFLSPSPSPREIVQGTLASQEFHGVNSPPTMGRG